MADKLHKKVKDMNRAYTLISDGLSLIQLHCKKNGDIDTHVWRIQKSLKELTQAIAKEFKKDRVEEEFKRMTDKLKLDN